MKYFIIAGERSGDLHGGNLVTELKKRDAEADVRGIGGDYMKAAGVSISIHYGDLAFMGFFEVAKNLRTIARFTRRCKKEILTFSPDVVILIDYGGFNMQIASFARKHHLKVFYYITPKVWAWYQKRAVRLRNTVDKMFVILPFEKDFFKTYDWEVDYVGNPVLDAIRKHRPDRQFLERHGFEGSKQVVALLPGSRKQELVRMIPLMSAVVGRFPDINFAVATVSNLDKALYHELTKHKNVRLVEENTYDLLMNSRAAIVTSGTATLETALLKVPQVVVYRTSTITYKFAKFLVSIPFISLVNLIAGRQIIRELIQSDANEMTVSDELQRLLFDSSYRQEILEGYEEIMLKLDTGSASENAAELMIGYLRPSS